jgi:ubiquitin-conjugating enzyme E2 C
MESKQAVTFPLQHVFSSTTCFSFSSTTSINLYPASLHHKLHHQIFHQSFIMDMANQAPAVATSKTVTTNPPQSNGNAKRLQTELMTLMMSPTPGISAFPNDGDLLNWTATIAGPTETPYEGLIFKLSFAFPGTYPLTAPTVLFKTPIYHPNIDFSGRICLDILKDKWSAIYNVQSVLLSLQSLLGEPNK